MDAIHAFLCQHNWLRMFIVEPFEAVSDAQDVAIWNAVVLAFAHKTLDNVIQPRAQPTTRHNCKQDK